jgi:hypothetical protein
MTNGSCCLIPEFWVELKGDMMEQDALGRCGSRDLLDVEGLLGILAGPRCRRKTYLLYGAFLLPFPKL